MGRDIDKRDFELFRSEFCKWQARFGLSGYKVYFDWRPLDGENARIVVTGQVATVCLNSENGREDWVHRSIREVAKHEAIHLLLNRLEANAMYRYTSKIEIEECVEELSYKLENLIK